MSQSHTKDVTGGAPNCGETVAESVVGTPVTTALGDATSTTPYWGAGGCGFGSGSGGGGTGPGGGGTKTLTGWIDTAVSVECTLPAVALTFTVPGVAVSVVVAMPLSSVWTA